MPKKAKVLFCSVLLSERNVTKAMWSLPKYFLGKWFTLILFPALFPLGHPSSQTNTCTRQPVLLKVLPPASKAAHWAKSPVASDSFFQEEFLSLVDPELPFLEKPLTSFSSFLMKNVYKNPSCLLKFIPDSPMLLFYTWTTPFVCYIEFFGHAICFLKMCFFTK